MVVQEMKIQEVSVGEPLTTSGAHGRARMNSMKSNAAASEA